MKGKALIFVLLMFSPAFAMLAVDKNSYNKGDAVLISGSGYSPGQVVNLIMGADYMILFSKRIVADSNGSFTYLYNLSFLDPEGAYMVSDGASSMNFTVFPTRNSSYYLVTFLSPSPRTYERTETLNIRVNISSAGEVVTNATVQTFDLKGKRVSLTEEGNGVYNCTFQIPADAPLKQENIVVLVKKYNLGGERKVAISIAKTTLNIDLIEPKLSKYDVGAKVLIKFTAKYSNKSVADVSVNVSVNNNFLNVSKKGDTYIAEYLPLISDEGILNLEIYVFDKYGNYGTHTMKLTIGGAFAYWLRINSWWIVALLVSGLVIFIIAQRKLSKATTINKLRKKRNNLINKKKDVQREYYVNKTIDKKIYDKLFTDINDQLVRLDEKMHELKKRRL